MANTLYELEVIHKKVLQEELVRNKLPHKKGKFSKILVGIDGSQPSMDAAGYALAMAKKDNAELIAIHVLSAKSGYEHTPQPLLFGLPATPSSVNDIIQTSKEEAQRWLDKVKEQQLDDENIEVKLKTEVILASTSIVAAELVDYAQEENVDLIVVGTKGRSGFKRLLLGSTASGVVTYAHCPVMIVKWIILVHPHGKLGDLWEKYLQAEAEFHFQELSAVTSELISGRTMYSPKHEDMFIKLLRKDMSWFMMDMIWFNDKEEKRI